MLEPYEGFAGAMQRVATANDASGRSYIAVQGGPSAAITNAGVGGLFEIWQETLKEALKPQNGEDRGPQTPKLLPDRGDLKVRWFIVDPGETLGDEELRARIREGFAAIEATEEHDDTDVHPAMHRTQTLDVICLISGTVKLRLDDGEVLLTPGNVVIQRATAHAWTALDKPALLVAMLIDRNIDDS